MTMHPRSVFEWLDEVRKRPSMFVGDKVSALTVIAGYLYGYYVAMDIHGILEPGPRLAQEHFSTWLRLRGYREFASGWASVLQDAHGSAAFDKFFELADEYRTVSPRMMARVTLTERHAPTGKRVRYGMNGRMERPDRVEIIRYVPEPMHILRFHYGSRFVEHPLHGPNVDPVTVLDDAFAWVTDELGVTQDEWTIP